MKWLSLGWWAYLFSEHHGWRNIVCRARGHAGPIFYNVGGLEPDWLCRNCHEDLG